MAQSVGARVRQLRREHDFTFDAFVEETGLGRGYVSELERGLVVPTIHTLARIAAAFEGVTMADLVLGEGVREQLFHVARNLPERDLRALLEQAKRQQPAKGKPQSE